MANMAKKHKPKKQQQMILGGSGRPQEPKPKKDIVASGVANGDAGFWTPELLKKLNFYNYQRDRNNQGQDIYE